MLIEPKYQIEDYATFKAESQALLTDNASEINPYNIPLDVDWKKYEILYKNGNVGAYTCRIEFRLVAYIILVADNHPHHKDKIFCTTDCFYVHPKYRRTKVAHNLIKFVESDLKHKGVSGFVIATPKTNPFGSGLESMGFSEVETAFYKRISE